MDYDHLILLPCHAVYTGTNQSDVYDPACWHGLYEGHEREVRRYLEHLDTALALLIEDPGSLLVVSGGMTTSTTWTPEALGYLNAGTQLGWIDAPMHDRILPEDRARDSFENLLFGCQRFQRAAGKSPCKVTTIGLAFKAARFAFHARTIQAEPAYDIPPFEFRFVGVNDPEGHAAHAGERATLAAFEACPHGDRGMLLEKRRRRDPYRIHHDG